VEKELAKREVKMSLVGLGVGKSEKELVKMKSIVNKVSSFFFVFHDRPPF
jgi:hypothetical protein